MKKAFSSTAALIALILATASQVGAELPVAGRRALVGSRYSDHGSPALLTSGLSGDPVAPAWRQPRDRAENLGLRRPAPGRAADAAGEGGHSPCRQGDRGRLIRNERVASYPTPASVRAYFDEWLAFYQDFYQFPPDLPVAFDYGFDSYKVTYCTVDTLLPGQAAARPTTATGMVSVPRKPEPLPTVVYLHGTSVSFYDAVSNPNIFGEFEERGESFDGPPSSSVFAGAGFINIAPDYLGLGDSTVPRHRYFHAATEASAAVDLLAYDDVYDIYEQTSDVFRRPYASTVSDLFDMQHFFDDVLFALPPNSRALLTSPYYAAVIEDPQNPLRVRLRQNAVDRWGPSAPLLVYHSPDDEEVPYEDALVSADRLRGSGAVVTVEPIPGSDHVNSWVRAMPRAVTWFRSLE